MKNRIEFSKLFMAVSLLTVISIFSCNTYDEGPTISLRFKKTRLEGEWKVMSRDGKDLSHNETYEFDSDNDARFFDDSKQVWFTPDKGKWKWEDDKENLSLVWEKNGAYEIEIKKLTMDEFWFDDQDNKLVKCKKQ